MKYQILAVGLNDDMLSHCRIHFAKRSIQLKKAKNIAEATHLLERETFHLLVLDMGCLHNKNLSEWIVDIRYDSFIPIIILSNFPEADIGSAIKAGADVCFDSKMPPSAIALLLSAQLRRYTEYNHLHTPEAAPFQVGDIVIDPHRRLVWVKGQEIKLRPREFNMLLYFMQNPNIVLTAEQICEHAWGMGDGYTHGISHPIYLLRRAIEPDPTNPTYIKTMRHVGYYFAVNK